MKKFLVILMVVAMASFLFVGCMPGVTPPADEDEDEEEEVAVAKTDTPYITTIGSGNSKVSLTSSLTQYTNNITVGGVGVAGAIVKLYIDDVLAGITSTGNFGTFDSLGITSAIVTEGVKVLHVTATQPGLAESDPSTKYTFTYDYTAPKIVSMVADSTANSITVTFDGDVDMSASSTATYWDDSALKPANWTWFNGTTSAALGASDVMIKVSGKAVKITPNNAVPTAGIYCYVTIATTLLDLASNGNSVALTFGGLSSP